jgi:DinB family protein
MDTPAVGSAQLARIERQYLDAQARLHWLTDGMPDERWGRRCEPGRWSVAECVAHLNLTSRASLPIMRRALDETSRMAPAGVRYHRDLVGWVMSVAVGPVPRLGRFRVGAIATPAPLAPGGDLPRDVVMAEFDRLQDEQVMLVRQSDGRPVDRVWVGSPLNARLRYTLYAGFVILARHQVRHIVQAERVWASGLD